MRRREFIALIGTGVAAWPLATRAQQSDWVRPIGDLMTRTEADLIGQAGIAVFRQRMLQLGWIDGHNLHIDAFWSADDDAKMRENVAQALALGPHVILAMGATSVQLLQNHT